MRRFKIAAAGLTAAIAIASNAAIYASAPQFSAPKQFPTGIYIQPSESGAYMPTPRPKGVDFYSEFANVPDYASFARLKDNDVMSFDTEFSDFYYIDNIHQLFSYSSKVYDYFNVDAVRFKEYRQYLERIGFRLSEELAVLISPDYFIENPEEFALYAENPRYIDLIRENILYDPDFKLDMNGVYSIETEYGYTIIAFGESANYNGGMKPVPCKEIRLYNLYYDVNIMGNIMKYVEDFESNIDSRTFYLYIPERESYIPVASDAVSAYVQQYDPSGYVTGAAEGSSDDYIERMVRYLGGTP